MGAVSAAENKILHEKKRIRIKVANVLIEVRKRQDLHQVQEKHKKFREQKHALGRGPAPTGGDTTNFALGLSCLAEGDGEQAMTSPRRTALLHSLTLEELAQLREQPSFFFTGNQIAAAMTREQAAKAAEDSQSLSTLPSVMDSDAGKAPKGLYAGKVDGSVFEDLTEFFSVSSEEKKLDVAVYARNLRAQLIASAGRHNRLALAGLKNADMDWRKRLCRSEAEEETSEEQPSMEESASNEPLEMMPCLGRHPQVRNDQQSPTLMKVREVYERRDQQDAEWVEARREAISRRLALNAFKAREQQRELLLQDFKQKELHKVRMLQAEEKKAMLDAEVEERREVMGIQKIHRLMVANDRAERMKEEKRENAQMFLESWQEGVERAQQYSKKTEWEKRKEGERNHAKYVKRLTALGESRMVTVRTQGQKNDELKTRIQASLVSQHKEAQLQQSLANADAYKAKLEAAAERRHYAQLGSRYGFVEKAFGANGVGFDAKHHSVAVDRRGKSWQKSAETWNKMQSSFSAPELPPARPLSPGGAINESTFNALIDSICSKPESLAVAK